MTNTDTTYPTTVTGRQNAEKNGTSFEMTIYCINKVGLKIDSPTYCMLYNLQSIFHIKNDDHINVTQAWVMCSYLSVVD